MNRIRTGIVGTGAVAHFHARALRSLPDSELTACCNIRLPGAEAFGAQYGIPAFDDVREMIRRTGVEALCICTPHPAHRQFAVEALEMGVHVAVEKPLASTLADCDAIIEAAQKSGAIGATISQRRFYPPAQRVHRAIEDGKLGRPILGSVNMLGWRDMDYYNSAAWRGTWDGEGGGVLVNQAVHQLDLLLWYMGEAREVYGMWDTLNHPGLEVEDTAVAVIRFASGALGSISVSNSQHPALFGNVRVHGDNGASVGVQTDGGAMFIAGRSQSVEPPFNDLWTIPGEESMLSQWKAEDAACFAAPDAIEQFHRIQLADFLDAIHNGRKPLVTLEDGRRTVELFTAIYRSGRDHRPVVLPTTSRESDMDGRLPDA